MHIIICGTEQIGVSIAKQLASEGNEITIIGNSPEEIAKISETMDVKAYLAFPSHPNALYEVGAENADMIIAVTKSDEVNMVACQVAHSLFKVPIKIAHIRSQDYLQAEWMDLYAHDQLPIDYIISPEVEVAKAVINRLHVPGSIETIPLAYGKIKLIGVRCLESCPVLNLPLYKIQEKLVELKSVILGVVRNNEVFIGKKDFIIQEGDGIYISTETAKVNKVMSLFGHEEKEARKIIIVGGGNIGLFLADYLEKEESDIKVSLIEIDQERAEYVAEKLENTTVINGNALAEEILIEAGINSVETFVSVSNDDEVNILASLLAKRFGCQRVVTLIASSNSYTALTSSLGIDVAVNPREITISSILQHVRRGKIISVHSICEGSTEIIEAEVVEASEATGKMVVDLELTEGIEIGSIIRGDKVLFPKDEEVILPGDKIILMCYSHLVKKAERIFSERYDYY